MYSKAFISTLVLNSVLKAQMKLFSNPLQSRIKNQLVSYTLLSSRYLILLELAINLKFNLLVLFVTLIEHIL